MRRGPHVQTDRRSCAHHRRKDSRNALVRRSSWSAPKGVGLRLGSFVASEAADDVAAAAYLEFGQDVADVVAGGDR
jgi:hypothetical protein